MMFHTSEPWYGMVIFRLDGLQIACQISRQMKFDLQMSDSYFNMINKANLKDLIVATGLVILFKLDLNHGFSAHVTLKFDGWHKKQALCIITNPSVNSNWSYSPKTLNPGQNWRFLSRVTLKFDGWPCKIIGHLFYTMSSFVHHFKAMGLFIVELQCGNAQFGSKSKFFCPVWPWNLMDALKNNRAPHLYYIKLCASFQIHLWILTGVTVRKRSIWVKIGNFLFRVTLKFDGGPWKTIGNLF